VWNRIRQFCERWVEPSSHMNAGLSAAWLEFDLVAPPYNTPVPSVFVVVREDVPSAHGSLAAVEEALDLLLDKAFSREFRDGLRRCFEACSGDVRVRHVGAMLARHSDALRLCIHPLDSDHILPYLERIGWPGSVEELRSLLTPLLNLTDRIDMIDVDIGTSVFPQIGVECAFDRQPSAEPRWAPFLDHLVSLGLCTSRKRDGLLAWPGYTDPKTDTWPGLSGEVILLERRISHIKIGYHPGKPLEAKAYLWFDTAYFELQPGEPPDERSS